MLSHEPLGRIEDVAVSDDDRSAWLRSPTPDASKARAIGDATPESMLDAHCTFDDELREVMRQIAASERHRRTVNAGPLATYGFPS